MQSALGSTQLSQSLIIHCHIGRPDPKHVHFISLLAGPSHRKNLYLDNDKCVWRDDPGNARLTVGKVWCNSQPTSPADAHALHAVEESCEHVLAINAQACEKCSAVFLKASAIIESPGPFPLNHFTSQNFGWIPSGYKPVAGSVESISDTFIRLLKSDNAH